MGKNMSEEQIYELARKRAGAKRGFRIHFTVYVLVNITLFLVWAFVAGGGFPWFIFPIFGWGIGILVHYIGSHGAGKQSGESGGPAVEKEAEKIRQEQSNPGNPNSGSEMKG